MPKQCKEGTGFCDHFKKVAVCAITDSQVHNTAGPIANYTNVRLDRSNGAFNATTGIYTVKVPGLYLISASMHLGFFTDSTISLAVDGNLIINVNGTSYAQTGQDCVTNTYLLDPETLINGDRFDNSAVSALADLTLNDQVQLTFNTTNSFAEKRVVTTLNIVRLGN